MKKFVFLFLLAIAILTLTACGQKTAEPSAAAAAAPETEALIAEGRLLPRQSLAQSFSVPGQVAEILVQDGEQVTSGQVLARLEASPEVQAALARAQQEALAARQALDDLTALAEVSLAQGKLAVIEAQKQVDAVQKKFDQDESDENQAQLNAAVAVLKQAESRQSRLESGEGVDPDALAAAEARLEAAQAAETAAQASLAALELKASQDGVVVDADLQVRERVAAGQAAFTLADFSTWLVKTDNLTEVDVVGVEVGQQVQVVLDALPEVTLTGQVSHINARYEEKRGDITYTVTIELLQTDPRTRWGMTAAVQFLP